MSAHTPSDDPFPKLRLSVRLLDQCKTSVEQDASHRCCAYDALPCTLEIVCYKSAEGEFASCLLSGSLRLSLGQDWQKNAADHEFRHKACRSVAMGWPVYIPISAE